MAKNCFGAIKSRSHDMPPTPKTPRRVAFLLDLRWGYKHHAALFTGTQRYARTQGWESVIDENVADKLPTSRTRSIPYDGILCRANRKLIQRAGQLSLPLVNVWLASPAWREAPGWRGPDTCTAAGQYVGLGSGRTWEKASESNSGSGGAVGRASSRGCGRARMGHACKMAGRKCP